MDREGPRPEIRPARRFHGSRFRYGCGHCAKRQIRQCIGAVEEHMTRSNTVSAIIPTRGRPELVVRAVRSALAQTYKDLEVIVVIDGPDPATEKTLEQSADKRLKVIVLSDAIGAAQARNIGATSARGGWIAFLD